MRGCKNESNTDADQLGAQSTQAGLTLLALSLQPDRHCIENTPNPGPGL